MIKDEYFYNNTWNECTEEELSELSNNNETLINRRTIFSPVNRLSIYYREGSHFYHRWDGPAIQSYLGNKIVDETWYLHGTRINAFNQYCCDTEALTDNLFKYVQDYPHFLRQ